MYVLWYVILFYLFVRLLILAPRFLNKTMNIFKAAYLHLQATLKPVPLLIRPII